MKNMIDYNSGSSVWGLMQEVDCSEDIFLVVQRQLNAGQLFRLQRNIVNNFIGISISVNRDGEIIIHDLIYVCGCHLWSRVLALKKYEIRVAADL